MNDWGFILHRARVISLHYHIQTSSGAHTTSYTMSTEGSFLGVKAPGA